MHSVPRLMPGQGVIVGVGAITYPPEYEGADPQTLAEIGVSKVVTLTSTYDHRIIQGAESGEFLAAMHDLLARRATASTTRSSPASACRTNRPAGRRDHQPLEGSVEALEKASRCSSSINMYRVRGHLDREPRSARAEGAAARTPSSTRSTGASRSGTSTASSRPAASPASATMKLRDILGVLRDAYARTIGVEYMHIQEPDQKAWIQQQVEGVHVEATADDKRAILAALERGRGVRALPAHEVPRAEALQPRRRARR